MDPLTPEQDAFIEQLGIVVANAYFHGGTVDVPTDLGARVVEADDGSFHISVYQPLPDDGERELMRFELRPRELP
jgi:hypothetical protein